MRERREKRRRNLDKINIEFKKEGGRCFTGQDMQNIREQCRRCFGRPHIPAYMIKKRHRAGYAGSI